MQSRDDRTEQAGPGRRICFVTEALGPGGAERVISLLASRWVMAGWHVSICTFDTPEDRVYHEIDSRVQLIRLGGAAVPRGWRRGFELLRRIPPLRAALVRDRPDLVFSFLTKINVLTLLATIGTGLKLAVCERNNPVKQAANPFWHRASNLLVRRADVIVAQTARVLDTIPAAMYRRAIVIPNPIMLPAGQPADYDAPGLSRLIAVGRLTHQKGFDLLIEAFGRAAADHADWVLEIWGEGPDRETLQAVIGASPAADRIILKGVSEMPGGWAEGASAFVLPSRYEGFPNVLGEAMLCGLPAVAFDCPYGPRELIRNGYDGLLVECENVSAMARTLGLVMASPSLRRSIGENARHSAKRFAADRIARRWEMMIARITRVGALGHEGLPEVLVETHLPKRRRRQ